MNTTEETRRLKELDSDITANDLEESETVKETEDSPVCTVRKRPRFDFTGLKSRLPELLKKTGSSKARPVIIAASAAVIGLAVYFNWMLFSGAQTSDPAYDAELEGAENLLGQSVYVDGDADYEEESYFAMSQLSRQRARDEALEVLQLVIEDEAALKEVKDQAFADANRMAAEIAGEANIETLIMAKGFEDCVAVVSNNNANIIVRSDGLLQNEIAQIKEIVFEQTGILPVNVKIIEKN